MVENLPANTGDIKETDSIPGLGRSLREGHGNPLQYSCWENPLDRGTWQAIVHRAAKSQTQLKRLSMHARTLKTLSMIPSDSKILFCVCVNCSVMSSSLRPHGL